MAIVFGAAHNVRMKNTLRMSLLALAMASPLRAQVADSGAYIVRLGQDTLVMERFIRTPRGVHAEALIRSPATVLRRYHLELNERGGMQRLVTTDVTAAGNVTRTDTLVVDGGNAVVRTVIGDSTSERRFVLRDDALPFLNLVQWPNELAAARAGKMIGDSAIVAYHSGNNVTNFVVRRLSADSVALRHPLRGVSYIVVDKQGRMQRLDGRATTLKLEVERRAWLPWDDMVKIAVRDASRPRQELSPRGETSSIVDGARMSLSYGRPQKRGRTIFPNVVPYGQLWRTGANTATQFATDRALLIDGKVLPAGAYSIFSIPQEGVWTIIINGQTNQSGTSYDSSRDVMRVPAPVARLSGVVEQFTILIEDTPSGGVIRLQWDDREAVLPFAVQ